MVFKTGGPENTEETIKIALNTAREKGIEHIIVASTSGKTALFMKNIPNIHIVCVTHAYGMRTSGENSMPAETRKELIESGMDVLTTSHVLSGAERGISKKCGGVGPVEMMAHTLRMLCSGVKVGVEISVMALDAGLIPYKERVITIGGTGKGADTVLVITPSYASTILDTRVHEIICKPE